MWITRGLDNLPVYNSKVIHRKEQSYAQDIHKTQKGGANERQAQADFMGKGF